MSEGRVAERERLEERRDAIIRNIEDDTDHIVEVLRADAATRIDRARWQCHRDIAALLAEAGQ